MIARDDLLRSVPFEQRDGESEGDGLTLDGYAAVFGQATEIDSWEGSFFETIRKGAFRKSIRERTPVMQFDHGRHPLVGSIPIGAITDLREDDQGLYVAARLSDNWLIEPVRDAIRDGSVDGMSFRFSVVRDEWRDKDGKLVKADELAHLLWDPGERGPLERTLIELRVRELGPVVFPAYDGTSVGVRAATLAAEIRSDGDMRREVQVALAREVTATAVPADTGDLDDPDVRREVARALLFGPSDPKTPDAPPLGGHPSTPEIDRSEGAPARDGHPPEGTDAPPSDGHPSPTTSQELRAEIAEKAARMREHLASIENKEA